MTEAIETQNQEADGWNVSPDWTHSDEKSCPRCRSIHGQWRGYRHQKGAIVHRRWCSRCGKWFTKGLVLNREEEYLAAEALRQEKLWFDSWQEAYEAAEDGLPR
jgi:hypothetical protein